MDTREQDLKELFEARQKAQNGFWRDRIDKSIYSISKESKLTRSEREKLVQAVRAGDRRGVSYFQQRLQKMQADKTYGKQY